MLKRGNMKLKLKTKLMLKWWLHWAVACLAGAITALGLLIILGYAMGTYGAELEKKSYTEEEVSKLLQELSTKFSKDMLAACTEGTSFYLEETFTDGTSKIKGLYRCVPALKLREASWTDSKYSY